MTDIQVSNITNASSTSNGTGVFDKLMQSVELHIDKQYQNNRIKGTDYATVYLGALQSVLQQAITFTLTEQEAGKKADLIDAQIIQANEQTDLVIAQTAQAYEAVTSSEAETNRQNLLNSKNVLKVQKEILFVESQTSELLANGTKDRLVKDSQIAKLDGETLRIAEELSLLSQKIISETAQTVDPTGGIMKSQLDLQLAQKFAFKAKHLAEVNKQMLDAFATVYAVTDGAPTGGLPTFLNDANVTLNAHITDTKDAMASVV